MAKLPYFPFYTGDWLKDPALTLCSPLTRGIWIDFLCVMHELDRSGVISGSREQLSRLGRCSVVQLDQALSELSTYKTAEITERNGIVTVVNRRMSRENKERMQNNERVSKHRGKAKRNGNGECNGDVTPDIHIQFQNNNTLPPSRTRGPEKEIPEPEQPALNSQTRQGGGITLQQCIDTGDLVGLTRQQSESFFYHYDTRFWMIKTANGSVPITIDNLKSAMNSWRLKGFKYDTGGNGGSKPQEKQEELNSRINRVLGIENHEQK